MNNVSTIKPIVNLSQATEETARDALRKLHSVFCGGVGLSTLPAFDDCSVADLNKVMGRAYDSLASLEAKRADEKYGALRGKVTAILESQRAGAMKDQAEIAALSESARKRFGQAISDSFNVPLSDLLAAFPAGTAYEAAVKALHEMRFAVSAAPGRPGADGKRSHFVKVSLKVEAVPSVATETNEAAQ